MNQLPSFLALPSDYSGEEWTRCQRAVEEDPTLCNSFKWCREEAHACWWTPVCKYLVVLLHFPQCNFSVCVKRTDIYPFKVPFLHVCDTSSSSRSTCVPMQLAEIQSTSSSQQKPPGWSFVPHFQWDRAIFFILPQTLTTKLSLPVKEWEVSGDKSLVGEKKTIRGTRTLLHWVTNCRMLPLLWENPARLTFPSFGWWPLSERGTIGCAVWPGMAMLWLHGVPLVLPFPNRKWLTVDTLLLLRD